MTRNPATTKEKFSPKPVELVGVCIRHPGNTCVDRGTFFTNYTNADIHACEERLRVERVDNAETGEVG